MKSFAAFFEDEGNSFTYLAILLNTELQTMRDAAKVFRALADPTRRQILQELKGGELAAGAIAAIFKISGPSISRHLAILKEAELVQERREGNRIIYRLLGETLALHLGDFLSAVCPTQILQRTQIKRRKSQS